MQDDQLILAFPTRLVGPKESKHGILDTLEEHGVEKTLEYLHDPVGMIYTVSDPWDERKNKVAEYGMLICTKDYLGQGLGRMLVNKAE